MTKKERIETIPEDVNMTEEVEESVTGLDTASDRKEAEYDLVTGLLTALEYKTSEKNIVRYEVREKGEGDKLGKLLFAVHLTPISYADIRAARKKSTIYMPNPNGKKLPPIERERNDVVFNAYLIYLATVPEDRQKIWGNPAVMAKTMVKETFENIPLLLDAGNMDKMLKVIFEVSGLSDDDEDMDLETFR